MNQQPLVSIIMATFNRATLIEDSLVSITKQTYLNWECLIIDDHSDDETEGKVKSWIGKEDRFKYFKRSLNHKKGLPGCRNNGLDIAKGEYVVFIDDDDIAHPQLLELCIKEISVREVDYCRYLRSTFKGSFNKQFSFEEDYPVTLMDVNIIEEMVTNKIPFNSCQVLWKSSCFKGNWFQEDLMYAEEWELYSRILSNLIEGITIEKELFFARKHSKSNTGEYFSNNPIRKKSKVKAVILVMKNLNSKDLLSRSLLKHFLQLGFYLNSYLIIQEALSKSNYNILIKQSYKLLYLSYPFIRPLLILKGKIISLKH